jgi:hypothetical protein
MIRVHVIFAFRWFSNWFVIRIYSFLAMIRSHVIFAFYWFRSDSLFESIRFFPKEKLYSHSVGFALCWFRSDSLCASIDFFRKDSQSCCIRIPLVSHWFVIRIYSFFAMSRSHSVNMLYSHSVGFPVICYSHLIVFRNESQSCYIRIPLVSQWFVICIYSFFAMIRSHSVNMLYSHSVGFPVIRSSHLFVFCND